MCKLSMYAQSQHKQCGTTTSCTNWCKPSPKITPLITVRALTVNAGGITGGGIECQLHAWCVDHTQHLSLRLSSDSRTQVGCLDCGSEIEVPGFNVGHSVKGVIGDACHGARHIQGRGQGVIVSAGAHVGCQYRNTGPGESCADIHTPQSDIARVVDDHHMLHHLACSHRAASRKGIELGL